MLRYSYKISRENHMFSEVRYYDKNTFYLPRHSSFMIMHTFADGGNTGHSLVVRAFGDYSNTTNEGMQMSRCRSADFNGSSNR